MMGIVIESTPMGENAICINNVGGTLVLDFEDSMLMFYQFFLDDILKQFSTRRSLEEQHTQNHKNTTTQRFSLGKPQGRKPHKTSLV